MTAARITVMATIRMTPMTGDTPRSSPTRLLTFVPTVFSTMVVGHESPGSAGVALTPRSRRPSGPPTPHLSVGLSCLFSYVSARSYNVYVTTNSECRAVVESESRLSGRSERCGAMGRSSYSSLGFRLRSIAGGRSRGEINGTAMRPFRRSPTDRRLANSDPGLRRSTRSRGRRLADAAGSVKYDMADDGVSMETITCGDCEREQPFSLMRPKCEHCGSTFLAEGR